MQHAWLTSTRCMLAARHQFPKSASEAGSHRGGLFVACALLLAVHLVEVELCLALNVLHIVREASEARRVNVPVLRDDVRPDKDGARVRDAD